MKVLFYSSINIDTTYHVDHIVLEGETIPCSSVTTGAGGKGTNQSVAFARAIGKNSEHKVFLAGKCGKDASFIIEKLKESGVDTHFIKESALGSGTAMIQVDKSGKNSIIVYGGGNRDIQKEEIDYVLGSFSKGDWLCINCEINNLDYLINQAFKKEMKIILNPSPINEILDTVDFGKISSIIVNEVEVVAISGGEKDLSKALEIVENNYPSMEVILTEGSRGATYSKGGNRIFVPAQKVKAVDSTGAGDTFLGYFFASKLMDFSPEECMKRATKAASISVSKPGAMDSIPYIEDII